MKDSPLNMMFKKYFPKCGFIIEKYHYKGGVLYGDAEYGSESDS